MRSSSELPFNGATSAIEAKITSFRKTMTGENVREAYCGNKILFSNYSQTLPAIFDVFMRRYECQIWHFHKLTNQHVQCVHPTMRIVCEWIVVMWARQTSSKLEIETDQAKMSLNKFMHPRNIYRTPPDFKQLAIEFAEFRNVSKMVRTSIGFGPQSRCGNCNLSFLIVEHQR